MFSRRGSLLIIVAGLVTLLASLAMAFLVRMRTDADDMSWVLRETQARMMLVAACNYIQEASRLGLDDPATPRHEEGFGWIDVRDGKLGPKPAGDGTDDDSRFPIGSHARFPMYVMHRPPYAIQRQMVYNPLRTPVSDDPVPITDPGFGLPYLRFPDPQPVVDNGWKVGDLGASVSAANWAAFAAGDRAPVTGTTQQAWFRVYRQGPDEFVVTCGGGGTLGFRDWPEVLAVPGAADQFADDRAFFEAQQATEVRLWYLVRWSAAVAAPTRNHLDTFLTDDLVDADFGTATDDGAHNSTNGVRFADNYLSMPLNVEHEGSWDMSGFSSSWSGQTFGPNPVGTIRSIMRLRAPPTNW